MFRFSFPFLILAFALSCSFLLFLLFLLFGEKPQMVPLFTRLFYHASSSFRSFLSWSICLSLFVHSSAFLNLHVSASNFLFFSSLFLFFCPLFPFIIHEVLLQILPRFLIFDKKFPPPHIEIQGALENPQTLFATLIQEEMNGN